MNSRTSARSSSQAGGSSPGLMCSDCMGPWSHPRAMGSKSFEDQGCGRPHSPMYLLDVQQIRWENLAERGAQEHGAGWFLPASGRCVAAFERAPEDVQLPAVAQAVQARRALAGGAGTVEFLEHLAGEHACAEGLLVDRAVEHDLEDVLHLGQGEGFGEQAHRK